LNRCTSNLTIVSARENYLTRII